MKQNVFSRYHFIISTGFISSYKIIVRDSYAGFFSRSIKVPSLLLEYVYADLWAEMSIGLDLDWTGSGL